ncbi:MAG: type VI secretion system tube protein Hcp [Pseudomonadota bacterium]
MAVDFFLKLEGIKGESKDSKHKDEIDVLAWSWGVTQSGTMHLGGGAGAGKANAQDLTITKYVDLSSPVLARFCASGKHVSKGDFVVRKAGDKPLEYMKIKLTDVLISSYQTGGSGSDERITESVSLNFAKIEYQYFSQSQTGDVDKDEKMAFNAQDNTWS